VIKHKTAALQTLEEKFSNVSSLRNCILKITAEQPLKMTAELTIENDCRSDY